MTILVNALKQLMCFVFLRLVFLTNCAVWPLGISLSSPLSPLDAIAVVVVSNSAFWRDRVVRAHLLTFLLQN